MSINQWQAGTLYLPGTVVSRRATPENVIGEITNPDFELGDINWTKTADFTIGPTASFSGTQAAILTTIPSIYSTMLNDSFADVIPGQSITIKAMIYAALADQTISLGFRFYNAAFGLIISTGSAISLTIDEWIEGTATYVAPTDAAYVKVFVQSNGSNGLIKFDNFSWGLASSSSGSDGLVFKSIQSETGTSGAEEPVWPTVAGGTVVDGTVTWEAATAVTVTWEAKPILVSGVSEPTWPLVSGAVVADGSISWETKRLSIDDPNCPNTREVAIGASKIFAGDYDIVRFSATLNPRDWTTQEDAGFLASGLQQGEQVGVSALGVYRGNLSVWSESSFQIWQIDPDPSAMALLDAMEGIGSEHHKAVQPVSNDLFFLAALGVRTVGVAAGSTNLATGDAGVPIDTLVQVEVTDSVDPIATYYPSAGQYWLAFPPYTESEPGDPPPTEPDTPPPVTGICGSSDNLEQGQLLNVSGLSQGGATNYISENSAFINGVSFSDTKVVSFTFAFTRAAAPDVGFKLHLIQIYDPDAASDSFSIYMDSDGFLQIEGRNSAGTQILDAQITNNTASFADGDLYVIAGVIDLSDTAKREIWINAIDVALSSQYLTWTTYTDDTLSLSDTGVPPYKNTYHFGVSVVTGAYWGNIGANYNGNLDTDMIGYCSFDDDCTLIPGAVWDSAGYVRDPQAWEGWYMVQPEVFFGASFWKNTGRSAPLFYAANNMELNYSDAYLNGDLQDDHIPNASGIVNAGIGGTTDATD